jgi:UPF0755 protein
MTNRHKTSGILPFLFFLLIIVGILIIWTGIPVLTQNTFGPAGSSLTSFQVRSYGLTLLIGKEELQNPVDPANPNSKPFQINEGSSVTSIAQDLENEGLIRSAQLFRKYLIYKGMDSTIKAGWFDLSPSLTSIEIAELLPSNNPIVSLYIYPGWRAEEIGLSLVTAGIRVSAEEFMNVVQNPSGIVFPNGFDDQSTVEGLLYPGEYFVSRDISAQDLVQLLVNQFALQLTPELENHGLPEGMTLSEVITLASIIQRESLVVDERPQISSVFFNRLNAGMKLETDPTVQYALGYSSEWGSWWKTSLTLSDLLVESPFNTYVVYGLPPHPISNPDISAIRAVLQPEDTPYYYFRAKCDGSGSHDFSITYEEHNSKACK